MLGPWVRRLRMAFRHSRLDAELDEEIRTHLAMATEEYVRQGMTLEDARRAALRSFGSEELVRERHREARGFPWLGGLVRDVRLAARILLKERGFTLTALVTLTMGIGANAAIVSVVDAVLLRPLVAAGVAFALLPLLRTRSARRFFRPFARRSKRVARTGTIEAPRGSGGRGGGPGGRAADRVRIDDPELRGAPLGGALDSELPLIDVRSMQDVIAGS